MLNPLLVFPCLSFRTPQSRAAYGAYKVYDEKVRPFAANKKTNEDASVNLKKSTSASSDSIPGSRHKSSASTENLISKNDVEAAAAYLNYVEPRLTVSTESTAVNSFEIPAPSERPSRSSSPGWRFGGFGFGRQGEKAAEERGFTISKPLSTLPSECIFLLQWEFPRCNHRTYVCVEALLTAYTVETGYATDKMGP